MMQPPNMMMPNMMPPHMMAQFGMGMPMPMQPFLPMMPHQMMQPRPLFPAAAATSSVPQHQIPPKPTFPAYRLFFPLQNQQISTILIVNNTIPFIV